MPVALFPNLIKPQSFAVCDFSNPYGDMKSFAKVLSKFFGEFGRSVRDNVDILRRSWFINLSIHRLSAEQNRIVPSLQKLKDGGLDLRERQRFVHHPLAKR